MLLDKDAIMRDRKRIDANFRRILRDRSRAMRSEMSAAELKLWSHLRGDKLAGLRFRRQHPIGIFIADFFYPALDLVVEVDGDSHFEPEQQQWDTDRTEHFVSIGLRELRFTNEQVLKNIDGVLNTIARAAGVL
jgi:very-short-patch-repair endonuclease